MSEWVNEKVSEWVNEKVSEWCYPRTTSDSATLELILTVLQKMYPRTDSDSAILRYQSDSAALDPNKLVDAEILGEEALELKVETVDAFKLKQLELEHKLKIKELDMKERLEMDKKEKEDEFKLKELEMKEKEKLKELEMRERLEMEKMKIEMVKEENNTKIQPKS
ncbi:chromatin assembly factor 1 subunit A-like [Mytilus edulis]|uniref:chromatin assembly factor 1 subunit A-like n=1 Tax=Mytilus edulis TaxID=6550 RepID=UPI0039F10DFD